MLVRFGVETVRVDLALARRAAAVGVRTRLKLPDAYALATAIHVEKRGHGDVVLESFDAKVVKAYISLHPLPPDLAYLQTAGRNSWRVRFPPQGLLV
jgi:predicted nucleic acid-binding protein